MNKYEPGDSVTDAVRRTFLKEGSEWAVKVAWTAIQNPKCHASDDTKRKWAKAATINVDLDKKGSKLTESGARS